MQFSHSKFLRGNDMNKKKTKETGGMSHHRVCTTIPSPQIISVSFFLRGGDSCTQAYTRHMKQKAFLGGGMPFTR